jgi:hypothetical protein
MKWGTAIWKKLTGNHSLSFLIIQSTFCQNHPATHHTPILLNPFKIPPFSFFRIYSAKAMNKWDPCWYVKGALMTRTVGEIRSPRGFTNLEDEKGGGADLR